MISRTAKRRIKKFLLWTEIILILIIGAGMGVVMGAFYQMNKLLPPDAVLDSYRPPVPTVIYSSDGVVLAKLAAENRSIITLDRVPKHMQDAIVAIEDSRFYKHSGLDYRGLARAVVANVSGQELSQGASTITMQLARNMFLSSRKKISRKLKEILLAVQIERNWTKKQILEAYLNQVYFGAGAYGVKTAAQIYFGKKVEDLTIPEAALIAGMVQRPSELSPYVAYAEEGNYDRSKLRRDMVIDRMAELKFITPQQAKEARETPVKVARERPRGTGYFKAKYFCQYVVDQLRDQYSYDEDLLNKSGLRVITTLNWKMQQQAEKAAKEGLAKFRRYHNVSEVALISLDPHTGYIRAMVGGVNEPWERYQFNCATQARRQPGSSFKTFVYAAAFEQGHSPYSSVAGNVIPIKMPDGSVYSPKNHGGSRGHMSYQSAFASSVNGAAVNVCVKVGPQKVADLAKRLGLKGELRPYPSLALGTSEASPLEMASAYGVFAAKGKRAEPTAILQIRNMDGEIIADVTPKVTGPLVKPHTVKSMDVLARAVVTSGTGRAASVVPEAHGKTGTSEEYTDAWFVGYTPDLATAVWAGNRDNSKMRRLYGGTICAPIWANYMKEAVALNPAKKKKPIATAIVTKKQRERRTVRAPKPVTVPVTADGNDRNRVRVTVCGETGLLAGDNCPKQTNDYLLGEQPLTRCPNHSGAKLAKTSAKKDGKKQNGAPASDTPASDGEKEKVKTETAPAGDRPLAGDAAGTESR